MGTKLLSREKTPITSLPLLFCVFFMINMEDSEVILVLQEMLCKHRQQLQVLRVHSPFLGV